MKEWLYDLKKIGGFVLFLCAFVASFILINQFLILFEFLSRINLILAWTVIGIIFLALVYVVYRIRQQLSKNHAVDSLAADASDEEISQYYSDLAKHLQSHVILQDNDIDPDATDQEIVQHYFHELDDQSRQVILDNANAIFLSTAISQNGSLDSFVVLFTMLRMVWNLASMYQTRPSLLSLGKLYLQVASVVLMARTIEDSDLIEHQMEPLITAIIGESIASAIPGMVPISNLIVGSLMEGAVNAFLTLRVGIITQEYLKGSDHVQAKEVKRSSSVQALKYMGLVMRQNGKIVVESIAKSVRKASMDTTKRWFKWGNKEEAES